MKYTAGILLITFTLFGCVTAPMDPNLASQDPEEAKKDNIICEKEYSVGSRIPKKVCYTAEEKERRSEESKQILNSARNKTGQTRSGTGRLNLVKKTNGPNLYALSGSNFHAFRRNVIKCTVQGWKKRIFN